MKVKFKAAILASLLLPLLAACDDQVIENDLEINVPTETELADYPQGQFNPIVLSQGEKLAAHAAVEFGVKYFSEVAVKNVDQDVVVSPYSSFSMLGMLTNGSDNHENIIQNMMPGRSFSLNEMNDYILKMDNALAKVDNAVTCSTDNSVWYNPSVTLHDVFSQAAEKYYRAETFREDLYSEASVTAINDWVRGKTNGFIPSIINKAPESPVALINAIYFKGAWNKPFDIKNTKLDYFTDIKGNKKSVNMMELNDEELLYSENADFGMLRMPYGNGNFEMVVMLPKSESNFAEALSRVDESYFTLLNSARVAIATVKMPRFDIDMTHFVDNYLSRTMLESMTFDRLLNGSILGCPTILQRARISVNEDGAEAAAITFASYTADLDSTPEEPQKISMILNRPFVYFIVEASTGTVLFGGTKVTF